MAADNPATIDSPGTLSAPVLLAFFPMTAGDVIMT